MAKFIGKWKFDFSKFRNNVNLAETENLFFKSQVPSWLGGHYVDDFSATVDTQRKSVDEYIEVIPYDNNKDELNSKIENGDVAVCMWPQLHNVEGFFAVQRPIDAERLLGQRGWHAEICYKNGNEDIMILGDNANLNIRHFPISQIPFEWLPNIYRVNWPDSRFEKKQIQKLKKQVVIWGKIFDNPVFTNERWTDPVDFTSIEELKEIANELLTNPGKPILGKMNCVQWVYTILCLSMCFPINTKHLAKYQNLETYISDKELLNIIHENDAEGVSVLPFAPYTPAKFVNNFLNLYASPGFDVHEMLKKAEFINLIQGFIPINILEQKLTTEGALKIITPEEKSICRVAPSTLYCESRNATQNEVDKPWVQYICTLAPRKLLMSNV